MEKTTGLGWLSQQWNFILEEHLHSSWLADMTLVTKNITTISCISSFIGGQYPFRDSGHYFTRWSQTCDSTQKAKYFLLFMNYYLWCVPTFLKVTTYPTAWCLRYMKMIGSVSGFKPLVQKFTEENVNYWTFCITVEECALFCTYQHEMRQVVYSFKLKMKSRPLRKGKFFHSPFLLLLHRYV